MAVMDAFLREGGTGAGDHWSVYTHTDLDGVTRLQVSISPIYEGVDALLDHREAVELANAISEGAGIVRTRYLNARQD